MNRRAFLASGAALSLPAAAGTAALAESRAASAAAEPSRWDAIRERIRLVGETFARGTFSFPEPIDPAEVEAMLALSDAEIESVGPLLPFANKYGLSLDWLFAGDVKALIHATRHANAERFARADDPLPGMVERWEALEAAISADCRATGGDFEAHPLFAERDALTRRIAETVPESVAGLTALAWAACELAGPQGVEGSELREEEMRSPETRIMVSLREGAKRIGKRIGERHA